MLWKKESRRKGGLYVDIFALSATDLETLHNREVNRDRNSKPIPKKDDFIALQKRNAGNDCYRSGEVQRAMELYNESLCYAKPESENISLAYANRATCFLKLKMFEQCLKDVELAREAGYPEHLMPKLDQREEVCLKQMLDDTDLNNIDVDKSFNPDDRFPCMVNSLEIQKDNANNFSAVAKEDIPAGQTVVIEQFFFGYLLKRFGLKCNICLKGYKNLVPCKKCAVAMSCDDCQNHFLHEYECGLNLCGPSMLNSEVLLEARKLLLGINMFPNVEGLINFIEAILQSDTKEIPESLMDNQSKYREFFTKATVPKGTTITEIAEMAFPVYKTILRIPKVKAMFRTKKHLRFLMHLIGHCAFIPTTNRTYGARSKQPELKQTPSQEYNDPYVLSREAWLMRELFQHSCTPNVLNISGNGQFVLVAGRPIKRGEHLRMSMVSMSIEPTERRQAMLMKDNRLSCECERCMGIRATKSQRKRMSNDSGFRFIVENKMLPFSSVAKDKKLDELAEHCVMFLQKYGRMNWCAELEMVLIIYQAVLNFCSSGPVF